uniref:Uncharacterized protein n=1 Tax=viral metagenome TaxID=1070528 RepID=A0A6H1ZTG4_9ZZZZ
MNGWLMIEQEEKLNSVLSGYLGNRVGNWLIINQENKIGVSEEGKLGENIRGE